jgi:hypothetical protein
MDLIRSFSYPDSDLDLVGRHPSVMDPSERDGHCSLKFDTTVPGELQTVPLTCPEKPQFASV